MEKIKVSQDFLYKYLQEHNITTVSIARMMGVSESIVGGSFRHALNRHGKPLKFSKANIKKLNTAIHQIANELRYDVITFGSDRTFTNQRGVTYDPGTMMAIDKIANYFNMKDFAKRVLGWNKGKRDMVLSVKSSPVYGNVSQADVDRINAELLSVAGVLSSYEVVGDGE